MSKRSVKLAMLPRTGKQTSAPQNLNGDRTPVARRERGSGEIVAVTMRMKRDDWKRLHAVAMDENSSLQGLFIIAMSALLESKGQPAMESINL
jgi:hypothetical protein